MQVLGIELSSPRGSVALLRDGEIVGEIAWDEAPRDSRRAFDALTRLLRDCGTTAADIDLFAAGRGPGNYSGMRVALTVATTLAMPGGRPVHAVDSGAVLADAVLQETAADDVLVAGDARRGRCWHAAFHRAQDGTAAAVTPWDLCDAAGLAARVPPAGIGATSDWPRLSAVASLPGPDAPWLGRSVYPSAAFAALRAHARWLRGEPSEPLAPLYLHPPVAMPAAGGASPSWNATRIA
jgi:tRNA threonylcarbamoyladenosine biosynthesis protein TsaB